jgi:hypothetical protein
MADNLRLDRLLLQTPEILVPLALPVTQEVQVLRGILVVQAMLVQRALRLRVFVELSLEALVVMVERRVMEGLREMLEPVGLVDQEELVDQEVVLGLVPITVLAALLLILVILVLVVTAEEVATKDLSVLAYLAVEGVAGQGR